MSEIIIFNEYEKTYNAVLARAYSLLGLSMVSTLIGAVAGSILMSRFSINPLAMYAVLVTAYLLCAYFGDKDKDSVVGVVVLFALSGFFGLSLGVTLEYTLHLQNGIPILATAVGGTVLALLMLAGITAISKEDLNILGAFIYVSIFTAIIALIAHFILHFPPLSIFLIVAGISLTALMFSYFLDNFFENGDDNAVIIALNLYLGIYYIATGLLELLLSLNPFNKSPFDH